MRLIENKKLAARIGVITTAIILIGMTLLWLVVSTNAASQERFHLYLLHLGSDTVIGSAA